MNEKFKRGQISANAAKITLSVPLFIRLLEYAREDAPDDLILHHIAERAMGNSRLDMDDYKELVAKK